MAAFFLSQRFDLFEMRLPSSTMSPEVFESHCAQKHFLAIVNNAFDINGASLVNIKEDLQGVCKLHSFATCTHRLEKSFACEVDILEASDGNDEARRVWLENWLKKFAALGSTADIDISGRALSADEEELQARIELTQHQEILAFWKKEYQIAKEEFHLHSSRCGSDADPVLTEQLQRRLEDCQGKIVHLEETIPELQAGIAVHGVTVPKSPTKLTGELDSWCNTPIRSHEKRARSLSISEEKVLASPKFKAARKSKSTIPGNQLLQSDDKNDDEDLGCANVLQESFHSTKDLSIADSDAEDGASSGMSTPKAITPNTDPFMNIMQQMLDNASGVLKPMTYSWVSWGSAKNASNKKGKQSLNKTLLLYHSDESGRVICLSLPQKDGKQFMMKYQHLFDGDAAGDALLRYKECISYKSASGENRLEFSLAGYHSVNIRQVPDSNGQFRNLTRHYKASFEYFGEFEDKDKVCIISWVQHVGDPTSSQTDTKMRRLRLVDRDGFVLRVSAFGKKNVNLPWIRGQKVIIFNLTVQPTYKNALVNDTSLITLKNGVAPSFANLTEIDWKC